MKKFLGMPFHRNLSDSEYVERIRKDFRRRKWLALLPLASLVGIVWFIVWVGGSIRSVLPPWGVWCGFAMGLGFGFSVGAYFVEAIRWIMWTFTCSKEARTDRLLVKYYDALSQLAATGVLKDNPVRPGQSE